MKKIKCLVVDDDLLNADLISYYVGITPILREKGKCSSAAEAVEIMKKQPVDLIFLNIHLSDLNNKDFAWIQKSGVCIVIMSKFKEVAFIGFRINAVDCLIKPISYEMFQKAVVRVTESYVKKRTAS